MRVCAAANYPVDILNCGPLIRFWCMTFEAAIQLLKSFLTNCNYKDHIKRLATMWGIHTALQLDEVSLFVCHKWCGLWVAG